MFLIDREIGIECRDRMTLIDFGHAHDARIGERHWCVSIFPKQVAQGVDVLVDPERTSERTVLQEFEQCVVRPPVLRK